MASGQGPLSRRTTSGSGRTTAEPHSFGTEKPSGRLGAVLRSVGATSPVALGRHGPWLATTLEDARQVLTTPEVYDFPTDVSRQRLATPDDAASARSVHSITPPLSAAEVGAGRDVLVEELARSSAVLGRTTDLDAMEFLRQPMARSTTAAVVGSAVRADRDHIAALVLGWIDALGPVIAASRPPRRRSRLRRREAAALAALQAALTDVGCEDPADTATVLAAGVQVPIAAGAWLLVKLSENPDLADRLRARPDLDRALAWETVRVCPPTWITARVTSCEANLGRAIVPAAHVVLVSPLLLGQLPELVPGADDGAPLDRFDPFRWDQDRIRPGAWLPFGAGPHACPGRNLGLAQLTHLAGWARGRLLTPLETARIDQSRGIFPRPARLHVEGPEVKGD